MIKAADEIFRLQEENKKLKDGIKQAIEIIENRATYDGIYIDRADVLAILDKLIESEEK